MLAPLREQEGWRLEFVDPVDTGRRWRVWVDLDKMAEYAIKQGQDENVYVALATFRRGEDARRNIADSRRINALWADVDTGPGHSYASQQQAREALEAFPLKPSLLLSSGRGIHAYWRLSEPVDGAEFDRAVELVRGLAQRLHGDPNVADRARIMRIPGTNNLDPKRKKDGRTYPVSLLYCEDLAPGYSLDEFEAAGVQRVPRKGDAPAETTLDFDTDGGRVIANPRLGGMMRLLLEQAGDGGYQSTSEADMALITALVSPSGAALSPQDAYATFMASPRGQEVLGRKPKPEDYVRRSIERAVAFVQASRPTQEVRADLMVKDVLNDGERSSLLAELSDALRFRVLGVQRIVGDEPEFRMHTEYGLIIFGPWANLFTPSKFSQHVEPVTMLVLPPFKKGEWDNVRAMILKVAVDVEPSPELTEAGRIRSWLDQYLEAHTPPPASDPPSEHYACAVTGKPFRNADGDICIRMVELVKWVKFHLEERPTQRQVINALNAVGWESRFEHVDDGNGNRSTVRAWVAPRSWALGTEVAA